MKQTSLVRSALFLAALGLTIAPVRADIVTLKTGEKIEAKILEETPDSIKIEYRLTPKIKDTKVIQKSAIQEIKKQSAAEIEIEERGLRKLLPTHDLMTAGDYESMIQDKLRTFAAKYPGTPEAAEVEKIIEELTKEKARVSAGELKVEGAWLDAATVKRDTYNIEAYRIRLAMKAKAAEVKEGRYLAALREFDRLRNQYPASLQYIQAVPEAIQIMNLFEKQLSVMVTEEDVLNKQRASGLKNLQGSELQLTKASIQKEEQAFKALVDEQTKNKVTWKEIYKYDKKSLLEAQKTLFTERSKLQAMDLESLQKENETYLAIIRYMAEGKVAEAESSLDRLAVAAKASANNASSSGILADLKRQFALVKKTDIEKRKADAKSAQAQPPAEQPAAAAAPEGTSAVEEALRKAEEARKKKNEKPADAAKESEAKAKPADKPKTESADGEKPKVAVEESPSLMDTLTDYAPIIGGGILVVLILVILKGRKKNQE